MAIMQLSEQAIAAAYEAHGRVYGAQRGWEIKHHVDCWRRAQAAFEQGSIPDFEWLYLQLRNYWQVFRPHPARCWSAAETFGELRKLDEQSRGLSLRALTIADLGTCRSIIDCMSGIKPLKAGPSIVAISKFLHFWNPRLFIIVDDAVMWRWVFAHRWLWRQILAVREEIARELKLELPVGESCDVLSYLAILHWSAEVLRLNPPVQRLFVEHVRRNSPDSADRLPLKTYEAAAIEWLLLGVVELPPTGMEEGPAASPASTRMDHGLASVGPENPPSGGHRVGAPKERILNRALIQQVKLQSEFVFMADEHLQRALRHEDRRIGNTEVFYAIHSLLNAAGNISKALWGLRGRNGAHYQRRKCLRQAFDIDDSSPLYPLLDVRNGFEHYDSQLTKRIDDRENPDFIDCNICEETNIMNAGVMPLRHFNPASGDVRFMMSTFHLPTVVDEVRRIAQQIESAWCAMEASSS